MSKGSLAAGRETPRARATSESLRTVPDSPPSCLSTSGSTSTRPAREPRREPLGLGRRPEPLVEGQELDRFLEPFPELQRRRELDRVPGAESGAVRPMAREVTASDSSTTTRERTSAASLARARSRSASVKAPSRHLRASAEAISTSERRDTAALASNRGASPSGPAPRASLRQGAGIEEEDAEAVLPLVRERPAQGTAPDRQRATRLRQSGPTRFPRDHTEGSERFELRLQPRLTRGQRPKLGDRPAPVRHNEQRPGPDPAKVGSEVDLQLARSNGRTRGRCHVIIVIIGVARVKGLLVHVVGEGVRLGRPARRLPRDHFTQAAVARSMTNQTRGYVGGDAGRARRARRAGGDPPAAVGKAREAAQAGSRNDRPEAPGAISIR